MPMNPHLPPRPDRPYIPDDYVIVGAALDIRTINEAGDGYGEWQHIQNPTWKQLRDHVTDNLEDMAQAILDEKRLIEEDRLEIAGPGLMQLIKNLTLAVLPMVASLEQVHRDYDERVKNLGADSLDTTELDNPVSLEDLLKQFGPLPSQRG